MHGRRRSCALLTVIIATALSGCALFASPVSVPDGNGMCAVPPEPLYFGTPVENLSSNPITLTGARLGDSDGAALSGVLIFPQITEADGSTLMLGVGRDLASDSPDLWATRQPLDGFVVQPGQHVSVGFEVSRVPGSEIATVASQIITYRVNGEFFDRQATSRLRFAIAEDCDAIE